MRLNDNVTKIFQYFRDYLFNAIEFLSIFPIVIVITDFKLFENYQILVFLFKV